MCIRALKLLTSTVSLEEKRNRTRINSIWAIDNELGSLTGVHGSSKGMDADLIDTDSESEGMPPTYSEGERMQPPKDSGMISLIADQISALLSRTRDGNGCVCDIGSPHYIAAKVRVIVHGHSDLSGLCLECMRTGEYT
jgi:hypothetical protein